MHEKTRDNELKVFIARFSALPVFFWKEEDLRTIGHFFDAWFYASGFRRWWNGVLLGLTVRCLLRANELIG
ncbi:MAG TPA: hypothetical protein DD435_16515 [Cyanobacteria bacterium UBA8530]|nr:hypothetical protein [Cyanobacteria bacterium UBA8530]